MGCTAALQVDALKPIVTMYAILRWTSASYPLSELPPPPFCTREHIACLGLPGIMEFIRALPLRLNTLSAALRSHPSSMMDTACNGQAVPGRTCRHS